MPFGHGGHAAGGGSFTILRFDESDLPDVVYIEQLTSALYLESLPEVDHYLEVMNHLSTDALTPASDHALHPQAQHRFLICEARRPPAPIA